MQNLCELDHSIVDLDFAQFGWPSDHVENKINDFRRIALLQTSEIVNSRNNFDDLIDELICNFIFLILFSVCFCKSIYNNLNMDKDFQEGFKIILPVRFKFKGYSFFEHYQIKN